MELKIKVAPGHRYQEVSLRTAGGAKLWIGKGPRYTVIDTDNLAEGEDFTIDRYRREGRLLVRPVPPPAPEEAEAPEEG